MNELKRLDEIIQMTMRSIQESKTEITEISTFAKDECRGLEEEFARLKEEAKHVIVTVDELEHRLKQCKNKLSTVSKAFDEKLAKEIYEETDSVRIQLVIEKEKEKQILKRRNELEVHLKSVIKIYERADKLSNDFGIAFGVLSGDFKQITKQMDDIQNRVMLGIKVLEAQEAERSRIASDIHDGPAQKLSHLMFKTEFCIKLLDKDIEKTRVELGALKFLIRDTIDETRRLIYHLHPMTLDDLGLIPALQRLFQENSTQVKDIQFQYDKSKDFALNDSIRNTLYRIVQEAFNNITKHAKATRVVVALNEDDKNVILNITDNGVGFDLSTLHLNSDSTRGFGLSMMRERTNLLLGKFSIESRKGNGTSIRVEIPIND